MRYKTLFTIFIFALVASISTFGQSVTPESRWAKLDGNKIRYYDLGGSSPKAKDALVLIHGWTCNAEFWKDSYNAFPNYRVIALDLPGHGRSDKPRVSYTMEYFARSVAAVMKDAHVKRAVLVGHSMGTPIAREFYRLHPAKTRGIVIVDGALRTFFPKAAGEQLIGQMKANYKASAAGFVDGMLGEVKNNDRRRFIRDAMLSTPDHVAISAMEGMNDEKIWKEDKISVPVLALMAASPFWPADVKELFASIAPNIDFQMWTGVSHFLFMEKPDEFNEQVGAFVTKNKLL